MKKKEITSKKMQAVIKYGSIYVLKYQKEEREKKSRKVLEEIMAENFPEYNEKILHIYEEQQTPNLMKTKKSILRYFNCWNVKRQRKRKKF